MTTKKAEDWLRDGAVGLDSEVLEARMRGVVQIAKQLNSAYALDVLRIAHGGLAPARAETLESLIGSIVKLDPDFAPITGGFELQATACAIATRALERSDQLSDFVALAIRSAVCEGLRIPARTAALAERAEEHLEARSRALREHTPAPAGPLKGLNLDDLIAAAKEGDPAKVNVSLARAATEIATTDAARAAQIAALTRVAQSQITALSEEVNCLWWLVNGRSRRLGKKFAEVAQSELCLPLALELSQMMTLVPLPITAGEILQQALLLSKRKSPDRFTLCEAIAQSHDGLREDLGSAVSDLDLEDFTPIITGIMAFSEDPELVAASSEGALDFQRTTSSETVSKQLLNEVSLASVARRSK